MALAPALQEFRHLHLPGRVLLEDPDSGCFFVAAGQQPGGSPGVPSSVAWAWHNHEDKAEDIEGEVSLFWADLGMAGVVMGCAGPVLSPDFLPSGSDSQPPRPWLPRGF